jgi:hypothetical protein
LSKSVESPLCPPQPGVTRGTVLMNGWIARPFKSKHFDWTELTYVAHFDLRCTLLLRSSVTPPHSGQAPEWLKAKLLEEQLAILSTLQTQGAAAAFDSFAANPGLTGASLVESFMADARAAAMQVGCRPVVHAHATLTK